MPEDDRAIEAMARAIMEDCAKQDGVEDVSECVFDAGHLCWSYIDQSPFDFGSVARAALAALREVEAKE